MNGTSVSERSPGRQDTSQGIQGEMLEETMEGTEVLIESRQTPDRRPIPSHLVG